MTHSGSFHIAQHASFLKNNNVKGVFVNGSTGDFASLTVAERKELIETWSQERQNNFYVINHIGHTSLKVTKDLAIHSRGKCDAISVLAPFYFKLPSLLSLVEYCREVASCTPELPFYYYHIPGLTSANFDMIEFLKLADDKIPNLPAEFNVVPFAPTVIDLFNTVGY